MAIRFYTDEAYNLIKDTIRNIQQTDLHPVADFFSDLWKKTVQFLGLLKVENYSDRIDDWYRTVLDSHNTALAKVDAIFSAVEDVDIRSAKDLELAQDLIVNNLAIVNNLRDVISGRTSLESGQAIAAGYYATGNSLLTSLTASVYIRTALHGNNLNLFSDIYTGKEFASLTAAIAEGLVSKAVNVAVSLTKKTLSEAAKNIAYNIATVLFVAETFVSTTVIAQVTKGIIASKDMKNYLSDQPGNHLDSIDREGYTIMQTGRPSPSNPYQKGNLSIFNEKAPDAEYLKLTDIAYDVEEMDGNRAELFADELKKLPGANDPLKNVTADQITYIHNFETGFTAFVISDGKSAVAVFPGTKGLGDVVADLKLASGIGSNQAGEAIELVKQLTETHSSVALAGHSLGGYLATSATLYNEGVARCIAFDPPGRRKEWSLDSRFDASRASVVTTYENNGSFISWVGNSVGIEFRVELDNPDLLHHSRKKMYNSMNGKAEMENVWGKHEAETGSSSQSEVPATSDTLNNTVQFSPQYVIPTLAAGSLVGSNHADVSGLRSSISDTYRCLIDDVQNTPQ